jgi:hypothetical protein
LGWGGIFYQGYPNQQELPKIKRSFPLDLLIRRPADVDRRLRLGDFFIKEIMQDGKMLYERAGG